jgi:glycine/D-amino acid oxidase-like deaminating enzyme
VTTHIAIVGDGAIGLALAHRLASSPARPQVTVFGPQTIAEQYAGSWAAPAMINVFGEVTTKIEESWAARHMLDIGVAAMELWPDVVARLNRELAGLGEGPVALHRGTYLVARPNRPQETRNLAAVRKALSERGYPFEELDLKNGVGGPIIQPERFDSGIFIPDEMFVDARHVWEALRKALAARPNVEIRTAMVWSIDAERRILRDAEGRETGFDAVVLANSFGFNDLAEQLGVADKVPYLVRVYGVGLRAPERTAHPAVVRTPVYGSSCGDYAVHFPGFTYVGASALTNTHRVEITTQVQRSLDFHDPKANLNGLTLTGGIRAMSQDTYPLIGKLADGVWAAAGFFKSGVTLAPYVADLLGRELLGEARAHDNRFGPYRKIEETPPSVSELTQTVWSEIESSATSSGSRAQLRRHDWLVKLLVRLQVARTARKFRRGLYYNSDLVQLAIYDPSMIERLNRYSPSEAPPPAEAETGEATEMPRREAA